MLNQSKSNRIIYEREKVRVSRDWLIFHRSKVLYLIHIGSFDAYGAAKVDQAYNIDNKAKKG